MNHPHMSGDGSLSCIVSRSNELAEPTGEANPRVMNQNQLVTPSYTQPSTSNGVNTDIVYQGNNSPSPQPGPSRAPKRPNTGRENKKLADKKYREKQKEGKEKMERNLRELAEENKNLKRKYESLKEEKDLAEETYKQAKHKKNQLDSEVCRLRHQGASLRICVNAFIQKELAYANVEQQLKQLKDELASLTERIPWGEEWMSEKLQFLSMREQLKNENRILKVQAKALTNYINNEKSQSL